MNEPIEKKILQATCKHRKSIIKKIAVKINCINLAKIKV